jgi:hypothetical protein
VWQVSTVVSETDWSAYEDELREVFGFYRDSDPDPSEWFPPEDFHLFTPYLEALKEEARSQRRVDETHASRASRGNDRTRKDLDHEHDEASEALKQAKKERKRLDRDHQLREIRLRAETKLLELRESPDLL